MKNIFPAKAYSWKGRVVVSIIKFLLFFVSLAKRKKWKFPIKNYEENSRYFSFKDVVYFSYKYFYLNLIYGDKHAGTESYFESMSFPNVESKSGITISLGGDLLPYSCITKDTCSDLWNNCGHFFFSSDIVFANLETPVDISKPV